MKRSLSAALLMIAPLLMTALFLAKPAIAETAEQIVTGDHPDYYHCGKDEECVVVKGLCGEWRVVNIANEKKLTEAINYLSLASVCKEYAPMKAKPGSGCSPDRLCQMSQ